MEGEQLGPMSESERAADAISKLTGDQKQKIGEWVEGYKVPPPNERDYNEIDDNIDTFLKDSGIAGNETPADTRRHLRHYIRLLLIEKGKENQVTE